MSELPSLADSPQADRTQLRASDADRETVARALHTAMAEGRITIVELQDRLDVVYRATTLGELGPVTADLPGHVSLVTPAPQPVDPQLFGGSFDSAVAVAVLSGVERKGAWVVSSTFTAVAVMGGIELDLTEARFAAREVTINAFALMGGVDVTVPDGIDVRVHGFGIMGGFDHFKPRTPLPPGAQIIHVRGAALMGGVCFRSPGDRR